MELRAQQGHLHCCQHPVWTDQCERNISAFPGTREWDVSGRCVCSRGESEGSFLEPSPHSAGCGADGDRLQSREHKDKHIAAWDTAILENIFHHDSNPALGGQDSKIRGAWPWASQSKLDLGPLWGQGLDQRTCSPTSSWIKDHSNPHYSVIQIMPQLNFRHIKIIKC